MSACFFAQSSLRQGGQRLARDDIAAAAAPLKPGLRKALRYHHEHIIYALRSRWSRGFRWLIEIPFPLACKRSERRRSLRAESAQLAAGRPAAASSRTTFQPASEPASRATGSHNLLPAGACSHSRARGATEIQFFDSPLSARRKREPRARFSRARVGIPKRGELVLELTSRSRRG